MRLTEIVTPLKPLEAMAMGKAVVGSDVGGHKELIAHEKTGLLFRAGDVSALVRALVQLIADDNLRARLGASAASWVKKERSWKNLIAKHAEIYSRVLGVRSFVHAPPDQSYTNPSTRYS
jgi:glycosyltransferase involved in cell wall biosynthesis